MLTITFNSNNYFNSNPSYVASFNFLRTGCWVNSHSHSKFADLTPPSLLWVILWDSVDYNSIPRKSTMGDCDNNDTVMGKMKSSRTARKRMKWIPWPFLIILTFGTLLTFSLFLPRMIRLPTTAVELSQEE
jgi:hypothetical protein